MNDQISMDDLFTLIGRLTVKNEILRQQVVLLQQQIAQTDRNPSEVVEADLPPLKTKRAD